MYIYTCVCTSTLYIISRQTESEPFFFFRQVTRSILYVFPKRQRSRRETAVNESRKENLRIGHGSRTKRISLLSVSGLWVGACGSTQCKKIVSEQR